MVSPNFLHQYLSRYSWLAYSQQENGLPCVLFARSTDVWKGKGVFVETAFTNFRKMYEVCDLHATRDSTTKMPVLSVMFLVEKIRKW